ncbi:very short patch repair endonuclease [Blastococcus goldschmidtiae]|uniref:Very short patch repair endonuclease n=1 Tax=Blastococcus goldschmidtiae TaxID=3075546 RepID=A0ABU2K906_9ACTN|nr:very short patch repair endonuclease [Blastococcus sp. DSM 46792]MDT0276661.1 very short patch repair endonuclease [Blastococcus sp. DSM 46792]
MTTEPSRPSGRPTPSDPSVTARMSRQARRDTAPEVALRRELHRRGLRFRVDWPLPRMPRRRADIAFTRSHVAVFVDGCFWHSCPEHRTAPAANSAWWATKLDTNVRRDQATNEHLAALGWTVLRFWEHEDPLLAADAVAAAVRPPAAIGHPSGRGGCHETPPPATKVTSSTETATDRIQ